MKNKNINKIALISVLLTLPNISFSARRERAMKQASAKAVDKKNSIGLVTSKTIIKKCANPGDLNCLNSGKTDIGPFSCPSGQKKDSKNNCICEDNNLVVNPDDKTKCIAKNTNTIIALKKECGNVLIKAVSAGCEDSFAHNGKGGDNNDEYKCYDANELFALFDTSKLHIFTNGKSYKYDDVCYSYTEDFMKSIATEYEITGSNSIACKKARAVANASSECFALVISTGKAAGATNAIRGDLNNTCGVGGINAQYEKLFGTNAPSNIQFPSNLPDLYVNAGKSGVANGVDLVGKWLDGKITDKTDEWERDITKINNTYLNQVSINCGSEYSATLHDENIQLLSEKSSLQRSIDESGSIKGASDWAMNQASVFMGENTINKIKREGIVGGTKDADVKVGDNIQTLELDDDEITTDTIKNIIVSKKPATGRYIIISTSKNYRFIDLTNNTNDYSYSTVNYNEDMNLPASVLKLMLNGNESTSVSITDEKITK